MTYYLIFLPVALGVFLKWVYQWLHRNACKIVDTVGMQNCPLYQQTISQKELSIVIPAFNEKKRLPQTLADVLGSVKGVESCEIILVDDGSTDGTPLVAKSTFKQYTLEQEHNKVNLVIVRLAKNSGKGMAVSRGILESRGKVVLFMDSDGATDVREVARFYKILSSIEKPMILCGQRTKLKCKMSALRLVISGVFGYLSCFLSGSTLNEKPSKRALSDTQCGFKAFTRSACQQIFQSNHLKGWVFDVELLLIASRLAIPIQPISVEWSEKPGSKLCIKTDSFVMLFDMVMMRVMYDVGMWPIL